MDEINHRDGLEHEPHLKGKPIEPDDSNALEEEPVRASEVAFEPIDEMSASDEPALNWKRLDRKAVPGFAEYLDRQRGQTSLWVMIGAMALAAASAGPFAVLGTLLKSFTGQGGFGYMAVIVIGPVLEEMMKVAAILWIVERKAWLVPWPGTVLIVGLMGGLGFAAIENLLYLHVYVPNPTPELESWRWSVCVVMHGGCSLIAAIGVKRMLLHTLKSGQPASTALAFPWFVTAMLIHGSYNALAVSLSITGLSP